MIFIELFCILKYFSASVYDDVVKRSFAPELQMPCDRRCHNT